MNTSSEILLIIRESWFCWAETLTKLIKSTMNMHTTLLMRGYIFMSPKLVNFSIISLELPVY